MAVFLVFGLIALAMYFFFRSEEGKRKNLKEEILAKVQASGPERRAQCLRTNINDPQWWLINTWMMEDRLSLSRLDTLADVVYIQGAALACKEALRSQDPNKRTYMMAALREDARYIISKGPVGDGLMRDIHEVSGKKLPTLQDAIARDLLAKGPGSPGETVGVVVDAYEFFIPDDHEEEWEETFDAILDMRNVAALAGGHAPIPIETKEALIRLTWSGRSGCLAVLAFGIIWMELDQPRRDAMQDPQAFTLATQIIHETVSGRRPEAVQTDLTQLRLKARKLMSKSEVRTSS